MRIIATDQFPEESREFQVVTVPKIWVNDRTYIDGAAPTWEMMAVTLVMMAEQALDDSIAPGRFRTVGQ